MPGDSDQALEGASAATRGEGNRPLDEAPVVEADVEAPRPPEQAVMAEPDGDLAFAPGAEVPLPPPPDDVPRCPWCSARLDDPTAASCPSCGAQLAAAEPVDVPGVTAIDPVLLAMANRPKPERRTLASWLAGDTVDTHPPPTEEELAALARPDPAVRREMMRLELAAMGIVVEVEAPEASPAEEAAGPSPAEEGTEAAALGETADTGSAPPGDEAGTTPNPG